MERLLTIAELEASRPAWPAPVVLVPTMGALHAGHLALLRRAREIAGPMGTVAATIFVNPLQFDRPEDLRSYPQAMEADLHACADAGVDAVFAPDRRNFYAADHSLAVSESLLSTHLCGATRPGHFDGVCTVVLKLFHLLGPTDAVFGKKDYQQLAIIRRMVRDLSVPVKIHGLETIREPDGLAWSSRNLRLTEAQRADAPRIRQALLAARSIAPTGEQRPEPYLDAARHHIERSPAHARIDYLQLVDRATLQPVSRVTRPCLLATAVFYGEVRLIDNIEIS
jgi:pantoate--beta-alanine ligase